MEGRYEYDIGSKSLSILVRWLDRTAIFVLEDRRCILVFLIPQLDV